MKEMIMFNCDCGCGNGMVAYFDALDDEAVFISFYCDAMRYQEEGPLAALKKRLSFAWKILRGKDHCLHDIIIKKTQWGEFYSKICECNNIINSEEKTNETTI